MKSQIFGTHHVYKVASSNDCLLPAHYFKSYYNGISIIKCITELYVSNQLLIT